MGGGALGLRGDIGFVDGLLSLICVVFEIIYTILHIQP